jgi:hypothetical protein
VKPVALAICQPPRGRAGSGLTGEETCVNRCLTIVSREEQRNELLLTCFATRTPSGGVRMHGGSGKCWYFAWSCPRGSDGGPAPTRTWTSNVRPAPLPIIIKPAVRVGAVLHSTDNGKTGRVLRLVRGVQRGSLTQDSYGAFGNHCTSHSPLARPISLSRHPLLELSLSYQFQTCGSLRRDEEMVTMSASVMVPVMNNPSER